MSASTPAVLPQFAPTAHGCCVNTAVIYRTADGAYELTEWAPNELVPHDVTFDQAQKLAAECTHAGGGWQVASGHEWDAALNRNKVGPASDLPGVQSRIYWTRDAYASSPDDAFAVDGSSGDVLWHHRDAQFRVRFSRRVPASQFLPLGR